MELCGDQGAMIAWTGILAHKHGVKQRLEDTMVKQRWRTDEVDVPWRESGK
jgi:tRNA A37 threonylcarbamoyltransferase TsaD